MEPAPTPIGAVVFDFGGVLITSISNQIGNVAARHGVEIGVMHELLLGPRASGADHPWHRAERGEIAVAEIQGLLAPWAERVGVQLAGDEIDRLLAPGEYTVVDEMIDQVRAARERGLLTALLTNTFAEFRPTMERDLDLAMFDVVVESFAVASRKPERAIFGITATRLGVAPGEILYLDDFDQNLVPPRELGWATLHVTDPVMAAAELASRLRS